MKLQSLFVAASLLSLNLTQLSAQTTSAGNSAYLNYNAWNATGSPKPPMYFNCGTNNVLNTGMELTMEVWVNLRTTTDNQKIMGKLTSDGNSFNNGYLQAIQGGGNYSEIWNPALNSLQAGAAPVNSAWIHLATTYAVSGNMTAYINGKKVGYIPVSGNSIVSSTDPLIIGVAPWNLQSFQTFGYIDEIRIWNTERQQTDIQQYMHKHLRGDEPGLVAYYDFNQTTGDTLPDLTSFANDGVLSPGSTPYFSWQPSYAAVADTQMYSMVDMYGVWFGKDPLQYNTAATGNGLSMVANIQPSQYNYAVYGHNDSIGIDSTDLPAAASSNFKRLNREWYVNKGGNIRANLYFNLDSASGGGTVLPKNQSLEYYTLLTRDSLNQPFVAQASANAILGGGAVIQFDNVTLENKYYTIGVGNTQIAPPSSVDEMDAWAKSVVLYPNPSAESLTITNVYDAEINIYNVLGNLVKTVKSDRENLSIDVKSLENGVYVVQMKRKNRIVVKRAVIQK